MGTFDILVTCKSIVIGEKRRELNVWNAPGYSATKATGPHENERVVLIPAHTFSSGIFSSVARLLPSLQQVAMGQLSCLV